MVTDQIDPETGDELPVGSLECSQPAAQACSEPALVDLGPDLLGGVSEHLIAQAVQPVFEQCLVCCFPLVNIECGFNMNQGNPQLSAQSWDRDRLTVSFGEIMKNGKDNSVLVESVQWTHLMGDVKQVFPWLSVASLIPASQLPVLSALSSAFRDHPSSHLEPFCCLCAECCSSRPSSIGWSGGSRLHGRDGRANHPAFFMYSDPVGKRSLVLWFWC